MRPARLALAASVAALLAAPAYAEVPIDVIGDTEVYFDALLQFDSAQYSNDFSRADGLALTPAQIAANTLSNNGQLRRSELILRGKTPTGEWQIGYDAVGTRGTGRNGRWLDVSYRGRINADWSYRLGQFKQPNSLEELTTTRNNEFISKATATNVFALARRVGAEVQYATPNITATATYFTREINVAQKVGTGWGTRFTWAPILDTEAGEVLHFGASAIRYDALGNRFNLTARPQADITNFNGLSATLADADDTTVLGAEAMYFRGPLKVMAEYLRSDTARFAGPDYSADGWYVSGTWTLGEELYGYRGGIYTTAVPSDPVGGMWQLAARYDEADADDGAILGGHQKSFTVGANWYIRSNFRLSLNYVMVDSSRVQSGVLIDNNPDILELRGQLTI